MTFNPTQNPSFEVETGQTITIDMANIDAIGFMITGAAGLQGSSNDTSPGEGGPGGEAAGLVDDGDSLTVTLASEDEGHFNGGAGGDGDGDGDEAANEPGGPGGGSSALEVDGIVVAHGYGGGGGGGQAYSFDSSPESGGGGGGGGGGPGGEAGTYGGSAEDGEDGEGTGDGGRGGDGVVTDGSTSTNDGHAGGASYSSGSVRGGSTTSGVNTTVEGTGSFWVYPDFGAPDITVERTGVRTVQVLIDPSDAGEVTLFRNGNEIAALTNGEREYIDDDVPTDTTLGYHTETDMEGITDVASTKEVTTNTTTISGVAERNGNVLSNATVIAVNRDEDIAETQSQTDNNGEFSFEVRPGYEYHVISEYDDGETMYNAPSFPFIET